MLGNRFEVPPDHVAGFRVQARLTESLVIPGVALSPRKVDDPR